MIAGYFFVFIVLVVIVKTYLWFRDWDRVEFCRVLRTRVLSSCVEWVEFCRVVRRRVVSTCVECVDTSRRESEGRASRADSGADSSSDDAMAA